MRVDYALQRLNMVESQVRPNDLTDRRIVHAMMSVAREAFLPERLHGVAYGDGELMLTPPETGDGGRQVLAPRTVAHLLQELDVSGDDVALLVGAGCGYEAALLAHLVQTVVAVEADRTLAAGAERALADQDVSNVVVVAGALDAGYAGEGPYDAIMINGAVDDVGAELLDQLKDGGKLVGLRRRDGVTRVACWQRDGEQFSDVDLMVAAGCVLEPFERKAAFVF